MGQDDRVNNNTRFYICILQIKCKSRQRYIRTIQQGYRVNIEHIVISASTFGVILFVMYQMYKDDYNDFFKF